MMKVRGINFNRVILAGAETKHLIETWNDYIDNYGSFTVCDLKDCLGIYESVYRDTQYGWTDKINLTENFTIIFYNEYFMYKLKLQPCKKLR